MTGEPAGAQLLSPDAGTAVLPVDLPAGAQVVAGAPTARYVELPAVRGVEVGVWEMTVGTVRDVEADEVFVVLSGRGTVTVDDGAVIELAHGAVVALSTGTRTTWRVTQTLRKVRVSI